jgi:multiple sugar transport system permease protein
MYNSYTGLALFHIAFQTGFCTLFMRNFIKALPFELIESARVEGVSEWQDLLVYRPAADASRHRGLVGADLHLHLERLFWATVLTQPSTCSRSRRACSRSTASGGAAWHLVSQGRSFAALPPVAMFFLMQKHFIAGLTLGAVK